MEPWQGPSHCLRWDNTRYLSQTWRNILSSLLPLSLSPAPYPSSPTWNPANKGPGKCKSKERDSEAGEEQEVDIRLPIM